MHKNVGVGVKTHIFIFWVGEKTDILYLSRVEKTKNEDKTSIERPEKRVCGNEQN